MRWKEVVCSRGGSKAEQLQQFKIGCASQLARNRISNAFAYIVCLLVGYGEWSERVHATKRPTLCLQSKVNVHQVQIKTMPFRSERSIVENSRIVVILLEQVQCYCGLVGIIIMHGDSTTIKFAACWIYFYIHKYKRLTTDVTLYTADKCDVTNIEWKLHNFFCKYIDSTAMCIQRKCCLGHCS